MFMALKTLPFLLPNVLQKNFPSSCMKCQFQTLSLWDSRNIKALFKGRAFIVEEQKSFDTGEKFSQNAPFRIRDAGYY